MNPAVMYRKLLSACLPLLLIACSSSSGNSSASDETPPLAGAAIGGPFTLTDSSGKTVHWSDFDGKYRIVYFGYTYCPDVCPLDMQHLMQGLAIYRKAHPDLASQIVPMFISVDPERDTPKVLGEFTSNFPGGLIGLTGTPDEIAKAAKEFAIYYEKGKVNSQGGYLVNHSTQAYLMGRKGQPIALVPVDKDPPAVAEALEKWVG
jgi:protein SCO1/2